MILLQYYISNLSKFITCKMDRDNRKFISKVDIYLSYINIALLKVFW